MATKPSSTFTHATDANFSSGPALGQPTKVVAPTTTQGYIPDTEIDAEFQNWQLNILGDWTVWLGEGSSSPLLAAHIVEADSTGLASLAGMSLGGVAAAFPALAVVANTGSTGAAITASNTLGGFAFVGSVSGALAAVRGVSTGTGAGVEGIGLGTNNHGVKGSGSGTGAGVLGETTGAGPGVKGTATSTGPAVRAEATTGKAVDAYATTGNAIYAETTTGGAIHGTCAAPLNPAIRGTNTTGIGVLGESTSGTAVSGTSVSGTGVYGTSGSSYGVQALSGTGNALLAWAPAGYAAEFLGDTTNPVRAVVRLRPADNDSSSPESGELGFNSTSTEYVGHDGTNRARFHVSPKGFAFGATPSRGSGVATDGTTYVTLATATCYVDPRRVGKIFINASIQFGSVGAANTDGIDILIYDETNAALIYSGIMPAPHAVAGKYDTVWSIAAEGYTLPAAGPIEISLQFRKVTHPGGSDAQATNATLSWQGVF